MTRSTEEARPTPKPRIGEARLLRFLRRVANPVADPTYRADVVARLEASLQTQSGNLARSEEQQRLLISDVAHELCSPLARMHQSIQVITILVMDSGPGLPPDLLEKIFQPFYRPDVARQRRTGGAGLGLAIVRSSVEACGGRVSAKLREPSGMAFEIQLPATLLA